MVLTSKDGIDSPNLQLQVQTGAFGTEKEVINLKPDFRS